MNIKITSFTNPFSFFCLNVDNDHMGEKLYEFSQVDIDKSVANKITQLDGNDGQYVAVMWKNKWVRGVISVETKFLIWLIDYGIYLRPNENFVIINLPIEYKKLPTKIFEASIHGVVPLDKVLSEDCQITNEKSTSWTQGSIDKCQELIKNASKICFRPLALLSTTNNDVILGDLLFEIEGRGLVNIIEELESWPVFLERNTKSYIADLPNIYITHRRHYLSSCKPEIPGSNLPNINTAINLEEYLSILKMSSNFISKLENVSDCSESTIMEYTSEFQIAPSDIERYSKSYITINNQEYNVLTMLINKARVLNICRRYQDHDLKCLGRGYSYKSQL